MRSMRLPQLRSIQTTIVVWVGISMFLMAAVLIAYAATSLRRVVIQQAEQQVLATAHAQVSTITSHFDHALDTTHILGQTFAAIKDRDRPLVLSRDGANTILTHVYTSYPQYVDIWSLWEPNAFDGKDADYVAKAPYDQTGRYNVYISRNAQGAIEMAPNTDYENADWYLVPRSTKRTYISEPYTYQLLGRDVLLTSIIEPVVVDDHYQGQVAVDIRAEFLQQMADTLSIYEGTGKLFLFSGSGKLMGVTGHPEDVGKALADVFPALAANKDGAKTAQETQYIGDELVIFVPIAVEGMAQPWGVGLTVPVHQISAEADRLMWQMIAVGGALALGSLILLWLVSGQIVRPLRRLTEAVHVIAGGNLNHQVEQNSNNEVGQLAAAFNHMTANLRSARSTEQQLRQAEVASRERLERAVDGYLVFTQQVEQGDLSQRLNVEQDGALGQLGHGLNRMVENLQRMTRQVQQATSAIAAAAAEILAATTQQAASAAEQSAAITQTTTTIEEVKAIAVQTADRAAQVAQDSQAALTVARQGTGAVEETVIGMSQIRARVESIASTILALAEQTQAIGTIITTVSELADQSNLLALNAAIEAARAGEQGKSFAVVAQHVRALAERSKGATAQVKEILSDIQKATQAAVLVTEEGTKGVEAGGQLAASAGSVIHEIAGEVESGAQASMQIAAAATQQTAGMEQVGQAMANIQQATTQALASTRQAERAAQDLHTLAQSLQQAIAAYRL
jgi:methyl-accepting chemotaxis protein